jgi:hypothetical protein
MAGRLKVEPYACELAHYDFIRCREFSDVFDSRVDLDKHDCLCSHTRASSGASAIFLFSLA